MAMTWDPSLTADQLVGIVGTLSSVIMLGGEQREQVLEDVRRLLRQHRGLEGADTAELRFRADCWRATRVEQ